MGFKPIVTGATSQRVNRFATATPVDTRSWCPIADSNCYPLIEGQVSCRIRRMGPGVFASAAANCLRVGIETGTPPGTRTWICRIKSPVF